MLFGIAIVFITTHLTPYHFHYEFVMFCCFSHPSMSDNPLIWLWSLAILHRNEYDRYTQIVYKFIDIDFVKWAVNVSLFTPDQMLLPMHSKVQVSVGVGVVENLLKHSKRSTSATIKGSWEVKSTLIQKHKFNKCHSIRLKNFQSSVFKFYRLYYLLLIPFQFDE